MGCNEQISPFGHPSAKNLLALWGFSPDLKIMDSILDSTVGTVPIPK